MGTLTNACLNLVKIFLILKIKKVLDWPRFLALEVSAFLVQIYYLDLIVFDFLFGFYDFSILAFFHLNFLSRFLNHFILDFCFWTYF